jgi:hypothetical protein
VSNLKAAVPIGLSIIISGVCDANAVTTLPVTETFSISTPVGASQTDRLPFAQFNPSLGTLTSVDFSLKSSISGIFSSGGPVVRVT